MIKGAAGLPSAVDNALWFGALLSVKLEPVGWLTGIAAITAVLSKLIETISSFFMILSFINQNGVTTVRKYYIWSNCKPIFYTFTTKNRHYIE
jgi:hypothetical protein